MFQLIHFLFVMFNVLLLASSFKTPFPQIKRSSNLWSTLVPESQVSQEIKVLQDRNIIPVPYIVHDELTIFIIDVSLPHGAQRIDAVRGAAATMLPKGKISVISCFGDDAEVTLEPTSSLALASRRLSTIHKSVMGNLGSGIDKAMIVAEKAFDEGMLSVNIAIIADSKAHGIITAHAHCDENIDVENCHFGLYDSAAKLANYEVELKAKGLRLHTIVLDTETKKKSGKYTEEAAHLASASHADYYHTPDLTDSELIRLISLSNLSKSLLSMQ